MTALKLPKKNNETGADDVSHHMSSADELGHGEDRGHQRDDDEADHAAGEDDAGRAEEAGEGFQGGLGLAVEELGRAAQAGVQRARGLAGDDHLDERRGQVLLLQRGEHRLAFADHDRGVVPDLLQTRQLADLASATENRRKSLVIDRPAQMAVVLSLVGTLGLVAVGAIVVSLSLVARFAILL